MAPLLNILILAPIYFSRLSSAAVPTPVPFVGSWSYLGCANEIPGRALSGASIAGDTMTVETCLDYCTESQFGLAGLEYGGEYAAHLPPSRPGITQVLKELSADSPM